MCERRSSPISHIGGGACDAVCTICAVCTVCIVVAIFLSGAVQVEI